MPFQQKLPPPVLLFSDFAGRVNRKKIFLNVFILTKLVYTQPAKLQKKHFSAILPAWVLNYIFHYFTVARGSKCDAQIIIGTPGTVLDWVMRHRAFDPKKISVFVLDEADIMISQQGHQDQSIRIKK